MNENLNIFHHYKINTIKALNKSSNIKEAANLLGISDRTLQKWKKDFNIVWDNKELQFKTETNHA